MTVIDPFDGPEIAMLAVAILTLLGSIFTAVIANRGRQHSLAARAQVENDHKTNFRDDTDQKDAQNKRLLSQLLRGQEQIGQKLRGVEDKLGTVEGDVSLLKDGWISNRERIQRLEDTDPGHARPTYRRDNRDVR